MPRNTSRNYRGTRRKYGKVGSRTRTSRRVSGRRRYGGRKRVGSASFAKRVRYQLTKQLAPIYYNYSSDLDFSQPIGTTNTVIYFDAALYNGATNSVNPFLTAATVPSDTLTKYIIKSAPYTTCWIPNTNRCVMNITCYYVKFRRDLNTSNIQLLLSSSAPLGIGSDWANPAYTPFDSALFTAYCKVTKSKTKKLQPGEATKFTLTRKYGYGRPNTTVSQLDFNESYANLCFYKAKFTTAMFFRIEADLAAGFSPGLPPSNPVTPAIFHCPVRFEAHYEYAVVAPTMVTRNYTSVYHNLYGPRGVMPGNLNVVDLSVPL